MIGRAAARVKRNVPRRLMFSTASHWSSFIRRIMLSRVMPALLTRICRPPHIFTTSSTTSPTRAESVTLQAKGSATPPAARMPSIVSWRVSTLMSMQATLAPAPARVQAIARPSPRAAPVTIAGRPLRSAEMRAAETFVFVGCGGCVMLTSLREGGRRRKELGVRSKIQHTQHCQVAPASNPAGRRHSTFYGLTSNSSSSFSFNQTSTLWHSTFRSMRRSRPRSTRPGPIS